MAKVRMYSPKPMRVIKRYKNKGRWRKQRPIGRGAGPTDDHGKPDPSPGMATGATAGIPGTWTPAGATPRANPASMAGIVASPATAWTSGQYVQTQLAGAAGRTTWTGTAWVGGAAPLEAYDPGAHTVAEVQAYVTEHPDEADAIYQAELNGSARSTLLAWLEAR